MMKDLSAVIIFALLQASLLNAEGNSSDPSLHHLHPRASPSSSADEDTLDSHTNLKFVTSKSPPEDAVKVFDDFEDTFYIVKYKDCIIDETFNFPKTSDTSSGQELTYLVNKDNFEIIEWKNTNDVLNGKIPFKPLEICKGQYILKKNNEITTDGIKEMKGTKTIVFLKKKIANIKHQNEEILCLNQDIKRQHLQNVQFEEIKQEQSNRLEVLKQFTIENKNCEPAKHQVKFDQGSDKASSFLKGRSHTVGGAIEGSVSGGIGLVSLSGKLSMRYDHIRSTSETKTHTDKFVHSVNTEIQVKPNYSCIINITSTRIRVEVPYSAQLIREYNNNVVRSTFIQGICEHEEVTELHTSVNTCKPLNEETECKEA